ncbi:hypothetical protein AAFF_G00131390 [Aldrovandia affinis]|uniref:Uncharacterized protein n=1 Tax=Aldrovandia affinis TaxID=143900 RepID=A0AAD7R132_9TELE|nr:hypothetical protein AAFF_G00131390 [Aldrovandia affinis]
MAVCSDDIIVPGPVSSSHEEHLYSVFEALSLSEGKCVSLHCWLLKEPSSCVRAELEGRLCCVSSFAHNGSQLTERGSYHIKGLDCIFSSKTKPGQAF